MGDSFNQHTFPHICIGKIRFISNAICALTIFCLFRYESGKKQQLKQQKQYTENGWIAHEPEQFMFDCGKYWQYCGLI